MHLTDRTAAKLFEHSLSTQSVFLPLPMLPIESLICRPFDQQKRYGHLWLEESERYQFTDGDDDTVACADLAEELEWHEDLANDDLEFYYQELGEWIDYVYQHELMLPLEQSCYEGVLLPIDQRAIRLETCPEILLKPLRWFFELCPEHVQSRVALDFYLLIRMDRARRTGSPEWKPQKATANPEPHAFFTAPILKFRNYAR
jgi:hypothetical protein